MGLEKSSVSDHNWPKPDEHVWTDWMQYNSNRPYLQYRMCVHPMCSANEKREAPKA